MNNVNEMRILLNQMKDIQKQTIEEGVISKSIYTLLTALSLNFNTVKAQIVSYEDPIGAQGLNVAMSDANKNIDLHSQPVAKNNLPKDLNIELQKIRETLVSITNVSTDKELVQIVTDLNNIKTYDDINNVTERIILAFRSKNINTDVLKKVQVDIKNQDVKELIKDYSNFDNQYQKFLHGENVKQFEYILIMIAICLIIVLLGILFPKK